MSHPLPVSGPTVTFGAGTADWPGMELELVVEVARVVGAVATALGVVVKVAQELRARRAGAGVPRRRGGIKRRGRARGRA